jgi:predicted XRE-type DNA-binding protein
MARKSGKQLEEIAVTPGSGNVFADMGLEEPEEELTKAQLTSEIRQVIKRRRLTQAAAAELMGIDQPKVSALLNYRLYTFSSGRLMRLLAALGQDVEITIRAKAHGRRYGTIRVVQEAVAPGKSKTASVRKRRAPKRIPTARAPR